LQGSRELTLVKKKCELSSVNRTGLEFSPQADGGVRWWLCGVGL